LRSCRPLNRQEEIVAVTHPPDTASKPRQAECHLTLSLARCSRPTSQHPSATFCFFPVVRISVPTASRMSCLIGSPDFIFPHLSGFGSHRVPDMIFSHFSGFESCHVRDFIFSYSSGFGSYHVSDFVFYRVSISVADHVPNLISCRVSHFVSYRVSRLALRLAGQSIPGCS
jgi:hypothetical protein